MAKAKVKLVRISLDEYDRSTLSVEYEHLCSGEMFVVLAAAL